MGKEAFNPIHLYCGIISFSTRTSRNIYQYRIYFSNKYKEGGEHSHGNENRSLCWKPSKGIL